MSEGGRGGKVEVRERVSEGGRGGKEGKERRRKES